MSVFKSAVKSVAFVAIAATVFVAAPAANAEVNSSGVEVASFSGAVGALAD